MDGQAIVSYALMSDTNNYVKPALKGLSDDDLTTQPNEHCNSIAWILWHQTRVEDGIIANISGKPQVWIEDRWYEKFHMEADPRYIGMGDSLEQVAAFRTSKETLLGYADAVRAHTLDVLHHLSATDLNREAATRVGPRKVGEYLGILMMDHFQHSGQIAYLRGYCTGKGWVPR